MLTSETKRRLDACRDLLVGKLPLPTDQVELITLTLIYKFMDDLDEESVAMGGKRSFFTGPLAPYRWRALLPQTVSGDERVALFSEGVEAIGNAKTGAHLPELFRDIFRNAFLKFRDGRILTLFLNEVNGFAYSHSEELGNAFEYLLQCMGTQGENGQFRTPRHIIDWIVACLDPQPTDKILDPACGTGGFLVSAYRHILQKHTSPGSKLPGDQLGHEQRQRLYANFTGYDITDLMVKLSKVNLFLHQFPSPAIHIYDSLSNDARWSEKADLILANPPFMTPKGGVTPHTKFRVPAKKAEVLFTDYIAEHLTPDGRAGIIVPNGIVATTQNAYVSLRRFLVEDSLVAVVSLPAGVFKPYSGVKTSILLLDKKLARRTDKILFLKIAADGFDLGDQRRPIEHDDLPLAKRYLDRWFNGQLSETPPELIPFKLVEKRELLADKNVPLSAERVLGESTPLHEEAERVKLGDVIDLEYGKPLKDENRSGNGFPVFGSNGPVGMHREFLVKGPFIIVGRKGSAGAVTFSQQSGWPIDTTFFVKLKRDDVDLKYVYWALLKADLNHVAESAGVPGLNRNDAYNLEIPLPPLEEQRRIVAEIEGYQQVIDGARQILAAYRPSFDLNPEWEMVALGEVCRLYQPKTITGRDLVENGPYVVFGANGVIGRYTEFNHEHPEVVITCRGATCGTINMTTEKCWITGNAMVATPADGRVEKQFLFYLLKATDFSSTITGSAQPQITRESLSPLEIPLPPQPEQRRIVAELDAEAAEVAAVRALIPRTEAKIQRVLARVWGTAA